MNIILTNIFQYLITLSISSIHARNVFIKSTLRSKHLTSRWQWNASYTSGIILMLWQVIKSTTTQTKTLAMFTSRFRSSLDCWWLSVSCRCIFLDFHILLNKMQQRYIPICIYVYNIKLNIKTLEKYCKCLLHYYCHIQQTYCYVWNQLYYYQPHPYNIELYIDAVCAQIRWDVSFHLC